MSVLNRKVKAVFFDLGYTLIYFDGDFARIIEDSYTVMAEKLLDAGISFNPQDFCRKFNEKMQVYYRQREVDLLERPVEQFVKETLSELEIHAVTDTLVRDAMNQMYLFSEKHWKIEKETHPVLQKLQSTQYQLGLITNASDAWDVTNLINDYRLRPYFSTILISAQEGVRKPSTEIFEKACAQLGVELSESVMVGDTLNADILGAHNSGMKAVWVKRRKDALDTSSLTNKQLIPDAEIDGLDELPAILESWQS